MPLRSAKEINEAHSGKAFRQAPADKTYVQNMVQEAAARRKDAQNTSVSTGLRIDACHDAALRVTCPVVLQLATSHFAAINATA